MPDLKKLRALTHHFDVLFVEDDERLQQTTVPIFQRLFKSLDTALHGKEGLEKYRHRKEQHEKYYDIVISDIHMRHMDGIDLSRELLQINPDQKIIITSAYNDKEYLIELINIGVSGFFQKPIEIENMSAVLERVCTALLDDNLIVLGAGCSYDVTKNCLFQDGEMVTEMSFQEQKLLELLCKHPNQHFSAVDIFNHIYYEQIDKEFSNDAIKSLVKRLRKKLPENVISNTPNLGYCIKL